MNDILNYFAKSLSNSTFSLRKKGILVEKPWALIDEDGEIQKLIFKKNKELILSKNGKVSMGSWDYFPEARSLMIDRVSDKLLLKEQYIDNNVLILKKDGTENDFFALANENTLPDYNIPRYLNDLKRKKFGIKQILFLDGEILQIYNAEGKTSHIDYYGNKIEKIDPNFNSITLTNEKRMTSDKSYTFYIENGRIKTISRNEVRELADGSTIEIENGAFGNYRNNINRKITVNGKPVNDGRLTGKENVIYEVKENILTEIYFISSYLLSNGTTIWLEQKEQFKINKGDKIVEFNPSSLPNGKYRLKGKLKKIKIVDGVIA